jgi:hypothetical protein
MSLDRFSNRDEILNSDGQYTALTWKTTDVDLLQLETVNVSLAESAVVELHAYVRDLGDYLVGGVIDDFYIDRSTIYIDHAQSISKFGIDRGEFEVCVNVYKPIIGDEFFPLLFIKEISPDRRELHLKLVPVEDPDLYANTIQNYLNDYEDAAAFDLSLNFGQNKIYKIVNQRDWLEPNDFVVRLYEPLPDDITENSRVWVIQELIDSIIDNISITVKPEDPITYTLRGANYEIDPGYTTITETDFKSWNELLGSNLTTSQQILDKYFSGSLAGIKLGIDYSAFDNFVFYSSARERLDNFIYKLELIEYYSASIANLQTASGSDSGSLQGNIQSNRRKLNSVIGGFDGWENWLYYESTASLTTHGISGSLLGADGYTITPWPKYLQNGTYVVHTVDSAIGSQWYNSLTSSANLYDDLNETSLVKTIPEHIRNDSNNSEYELFVNMIGHHFDILYSYIEALTKTYKPEEHPKLGPGKDVLYNVAESLGWKLTNGKQATSLWQYALGTSESGVFASTGSLFSKSDDDITTEVWRRIVNNLPYLLKTRGTARSIKALMNTYGIPQTLLSIREYGGPGVADTVPTLIEDRFAYAIEFNGSSSLRYDTDYTSGSLLYPLYTITGSIPPQTREFRFRPAYKQSMVLVSTDINVIGFGPRIASCIAIQYTGSYSGSDSYGRIVYSHADSTMPISASTDWLPLYDGDYWNLRWYWTTSQTTKNLEYYNSTNNTSTTYRVQIQKASDYINGQINVSSSLSVVPTGPVQHWIAWALNSGSISTQVILGNKSNNDSLYQILSGITSSMNGLYGFSGSMQEYKEWMELIDQPTFNDHTLNPTSYVSSISPTSSYYSLIRHYPLGSDLKAYDLSVDGTIISSSHPQNNIKDFSDPYNAEANNTNIYAYGFRAPLDIQRGNFTTVEETYYIQGVSLGGSLPRSEKIRLEDNYLVRQLSPTNTAERSRFDFAPLDSNRLGLFYSHADQINKDIYNQIGDISLDDYVGNPEDEFELEYPTLLHFSKEYWKKFSDRNDINAYIRIFSQFDFSLFNQIKQLLPERVDAVLGLLIEPHALERVKVQITKRPEITNPQYELLLSSPVSSASAEYINYDATIVATPSLSEIISLYHIGDNGYADTGNYLMYIPATDDPTLGTTYRYVSTIFPYKIDSASAANLGLAQEITSSQNNLITSPLGSIVEDFRPSDVFKLQVLHYSSSVEGDRYTRNKYQAYSQSIQRHYSSSLGNASYRDEFYVGLNNLYYDGSRISCPGINQPSLIAAIEFKPVVEVYETNPNQLIYNKDPQPIRPSSITPSGPRLSPGNITVR